MRRTANSSLHCTPNWRTISLISFHKEEVISVAAPKDRSQTQDRGHDAEGKTERLAARLNSEQKLIVERAAALSHQPVSQFVVNSAVRAAEETIRQHELIVLSARDSAAVMQALLHPEPAAPGLKRVAQRYKQFMEQW